jgi:methionyl-tRNA formyltransferase
MQMEAGLDTGPVMASAAIGIGEEETAGALQDRLAILGGELLIDNIDEILQGKLEAIPQDDALATYAGKIRRQDAAINWRLTAQKISRAIRAYDPAPGASFNLDGEIIKCWKAEPVDSGGGAAGTILSAGKDGIVVACAGGALRLMEIQRPGRRRVTAAEFSGQSELGGKRLH